jgi:hypothetical protein
MREFAARWNGAGVDRELVDADELQRLWASGRPVAPTTALLQAAWLATDGKSGTVTEPSSHDVANGTTA